MRFSLKNISNSSLKQITYLFSPKLILFLARNRGSLGPPNNTLFNKTNNIVDTNTNVDQSKVLVYPLLGELLEERKIDPHIF
jgi:hypothetical protein